jgi:hypothetical protein
VGVEELIMVVVIGRLAVGVKMGGRGGGGGDFGKWW